MAEFRSVAKNIRVAFCILIFLFTILPEIHSQAYRLSFRNIKLSEALITLTSQLDIKVAFDSRKLGAVMVNKDISGNNADEVMTNLLQGTGYKFRFKYNRYLIVMEDSSAEEDSASAFQIIGSVSDRQTGEQLPFATISAPDQDIVSSATETGSFSLRDVVTNPLHLQITYIGYCPLDTTIFLNERVSNVNFGLNSTFKTLDSIIVKGSRVEMVELRNDVDFATTINTGKLSDLPALVETDVFRILQVLPGISYGENAQGLSIRGGSTDQNLILFDGQTLYNLSHYYGVVSALNPNIIKDLQVYKGGYDSRFGERVSGIVDITGKSGSQTEPSVYGDINLVSANVTAEVPVGSKISLIGAVRRSYSDIYSTELSEALVSRNLEWFRNDSATIISQTKPRFYFYDYNTKISFRPSNIENFTLSIYGGKDNFRNSYSGSYRDLVVEATDRNVWSNYGISACWQKQWNETFYSSVQTGTSGYLNNSSNLTAIDRTFAPGTDPRFLPDTVNQFNVFSQNNLKDYFLSARGTLQQSSLNQISFGFLARNNSIYYHKDADKVYVYDNINQSGWTLSSYIQDRINIARRLVLKPGIRLSYFTGNGGWYAEPRLSANYTISSALSLRVATGKYYQFLKQILAQQETGYNKYFWVMADNTSHPVVSSIHYLAGVTFEKGRFLLDAEGYYKTYSGLQEYIFVSQYLKNSDFHEYFPGVNNLNEPPPNNPPQPSFYITGNGKSYGIDILIKYKGKNYSSWLSCSTGRSIQNYQRINGGDDIPSLVDQPFQLSWTNMFTAGKWNIGTMTLWSAGKPYLSHSVVNSDQTILRVYNRLPDYFRTDLSVNYSLAIHGVQLKPGISLNNLFNTHNYFDITTRKFDFESTSFTGVTLIESQAFSINAFIHFVF